MAGLTKEQRAERLAADKLLASGNGSDSDAPGQQPLNLIAMVLDSGWPTQQGMPTEAEVHPDEVERWQAEGWRLAD